MPMFIADTHSDTLYNLYRGQKMSEIDITPERLREGGVTLQTFALWSGSKGPACDYKAIAEGDAGDAASLVPNYLRLSQAERERLEKMK
jgi:microsomal dipeptidase-like Zn-dependent dipeptidase